MISFNTFSRTTSALLLAFVFTAGSTAHAQERDEFSIAWSIYVGWMPWGYGDAEGIVDK